MSELTEADKIHMHESLEMIYKYLCARFSPEAARAAQRLAEMQYTTSDLLAGHDACEWMAEVVRISRQAG